MKPKDYNELHKVFVYKNSRRGALDYYANRNINNFFYTRDPPFCRWLWKNFENIFYAKRTLPESIMCFSIQNFKKFQV